jgi:hypothetical protein
MTTGRDALSGCERLLLLQRRSLYTFPPDRIRIPNHDQLRFFSTTVTFKFTKSKDIFHLDLVRYLTVQPEVYPH